jgi:predicted  nucleic acid-binding Zn-ribbon protein
MTNDALFQKLLNSTIERLGKQTVVYEAEIVNLSSQIIALSSQIEELNKKAKAAEKPAKVTPLKDE